MPIAALRETLTKSPSLLHEIHPIKCEELVGAVLRDHMDCEVKHVGRTGDGGIDLILISGSTQFVVQVKRRVDPQSTEGIVPIRELIGAMILGEHKNGIFVSTSKTFSKAAKLAASVVPAKTKNIEKLELIDCRTFVELLHLTGPQITQPWQDRNWRKEFW